MEVSLLGTAHSTQTEALLLSGAVFLPSVGPYLSDNGHKLGHSV